MGTMTTPKNPYGEYQTAPGYGKPQLQAPPWNGSRGKAGQPIITGVTALKAAAIKHDRNNTSGLGPPGPSSQDLADQETDRAAANTAKRGIAWQNGYEKYKKEQDAAANPPAAAPESPEQHQRKQLILGGIQPPDADREISRLKAATPPPAGAPPVAAPAVGTPSTIPAVKPVATPAIAPATSPAEPSTVTDNGATSKLGDWLAQNKVRQSDPSRIGPQGSDAAALPGAQAHAAEMAKAAAPAPAPVPVAPVPTDTQTELARRQATYKKDQQDRMYPEGDAKHVAQQQSNAGVVQKANDDDIKALGKSMRPDTMQPPDNEDLPEGRAMGGPVTGGVPVGGVTNFTGTSGDENTRADGRKKGGPVKGSVYRAAGGPVDGEPQVVLGRPLPGGNNPGKFFKPMPVLPKRGPGMSVSAGGGGMGAGVSYLAKGGKTKPAKKYVVGDAGSPQKPKPELFMPKNEKDGPPQVIGENGPETGTFQTDGAVIPHHALASLKKQFSKPVEPDDDEAPAKKPKGGKGKPAPQSEMDDMKSAMRPQFAA